MENYDPNQPVGKMDQADYNQAFRNALKYNAKENIKKSRPWLWVYAILYIILFTWAIILAMKIPAGPNRTVHLVLALVFAPAYVVAYYMGMLKY